MLASFTTPIPNIIGAAPSFTPASNAAMTAFVAGLYNLPPFSNTTTAPSFTALKDVFANFFAWRFNFGLVLIFLIILDPAERPSVPVSATFVDSFFSNYQLVF